MTRFLNRLLALSAEAQVLVFSFFERLHAEIVAEAVENGKHDSGVLDLYAEKILGNTTHEIMRLNGLPVVLNSIQFDRGVAWST